MSAPVEHDTSLDDQKLYAPPWARERPLPVAGQPQSISSPPVASALEPAPTVVPEATPPSWAPRMPRGGPNLLCPPEFSGDLAMLSLRRKLALEPTVVPPPPIAAERETGMPWITRLGFLLLAAGIASFGVSFMATIEMGRLPLERERIAAPMLASAGSPEPSREPARLVVEDGKVAANEPLPLGVTLQGASGGEFILLNGLATGTRLTAGAPIGSKGWRLMARDLASVMAHAPRDYVGAMEAAIDLRSAGEMLLDSQVVRLEWVNKQPASLAAVAAPPPRLTLEPDEIARLVQRGEQFLRTGDISAARLMLRRAAEAGSAAAALGVGATFDPLVLQEMGVLGFAPNPGEARKWYQRAAELGSGEASRRLERLRPAEQ